MEQEAAKQWREELESYAKSGALAEIKANVPEPVMKEFNHHFGNTIAAVTQNLFSVARKGQETPQKKLYDVADTVNVAIYRLPGAFMDLEKAVPKDSPVKEQVVELKGVLTELKKLRNEVKKELPAELTPERASQLHEALSDNSYKNALDFIRHEPHGAKPECRGCADALGNILNQTTLYLGAVVKQDAVTSDDVQVLNGMLSERMGTVRDAVKEVAANAEEIFERKLTEGEKANVQALEEAYYRLSAFHNELREEVKKNPPEQQNTVT